MSDAKPVKQQTQAVSNLLWSSKYRWNWICETTNTSGAESVKQQIQAALSLDLRANKRQVRAMRNNEDCREQMKSR
eukprot:1156470-Pelagomonas_calceolata.AAC.3